MINLVGRRNNLVKTYFTYKIQTFGVTQRVDMRSRLTQLRIFNREYTIIIMTYKKMYITILFLGGSYIQISMVAIILIWFPENIFFEPNQTIFTVPSKVSSLSLSLNHCALTSYYCNMTDSEWHKIEVDSLCFSFNTLVAAWVVGTGVRVAIESSGKPTKKKTQHRKNRKLSKWKKSALLHLLPNSK